MSHVEDSVQTVSPSYFWSCLTLSNDCPFFTTIDPKLYYFGVGLIVMYGAFFLMAFGDLSFYWSLDKLQQQIDYYINLVRVKVRRVQMDQRRLMTTHERAQKQLKKTQECRLMVTALRGALAHNDEERFAQLTGKMDDVQASTSQAGTWSDMQSVIDF